MRPGSGNSGTTAARGVARTRTPAGGVVSTRVRPVRPDDLEAIAALRQRTFRHQQHARPDALAAYFERILLRNPWADAELTSLVYENADGRIAGFIGAIPRPMMFRQQPIRVVVATQMMVAPEARGIAGRELVRALLAGPQDLTLTDAANDPARLVWKGVGAIEAPLYGFEWERVLRPFQRLRHSTVPRHLATRAAGVVLQPLLRAADAIACSSSSWRLRQPTGLTEALDPTVIAAAAPSVFSEMELAPVFQGEALNWLLSEASEKKEFGRLGGAIVRETGGVVAGWFVHYVSPRGASRVLQLAARRRSFRNVVDHLLLDAWHQGATTVTGRLDAHLLPLMEEPRFTVRRQPPWTLAYSRRPEILHCVERAEGFFSRLDGESWLNF
jgi:ribosomal protein S18 acetylase RimI-like enzyme